MNSAASDTELFRMMSLREDHKAFQEIFNRYWDQLFQIALHKTKSPDLAQDLTQEVFISLWKYRHSIKIKAELSAYLITMVKYGFFKLAAQKEQQFEALNATDNTEPSHNLNGFSIMEFNELYDKIDTITDTLPPRCREIFLMKRNHEMSVEEIAKSFNISPSTVRNHLAKATGTFKEKLTEDIALASLLWILFN
ncbi:RNA polymerase sigma factor [Echinicola sp. 20G]|uniref:RNA polymerase sigma factor n=1 Tax=Echinicola sp. 20G TaxID=2781961 RepID=UPI0019109556|nr:sigma-70 family RNA polymerase sigma factor [Echinicola sp. 20G]